MDRKALAIASELLRHFATTYPDVDLVTECRALQLATWEVKARAKAEALDAADTYNGESLLDALVNDIVQKRLSLVSWVVLGAWLGPVLGSDYIYSLLYGQPNSDHLAAASDFRGLLFFVLPFGLVYLLWVVDLLRWSLASLFRLCLRCYLWWKWL